MRRGRSALAKMPTVEPDQVAHRGYLIRRRAHSGYSITVGVHVIQHQTPSVASAKAIIDSLLD